MVYYEVSMKRSKNMVLFLILTIVVILLTMILIGVASISMTAFVLVFGDIIACGLAGYLIVRFFRRKRKN